MKNTAKKIVSLASCFVVAASSMGIVGCGKKVGNDDQTLEIYAANFGYGYAWLESILQDFKQEDWVKEKYPNLKIPAIATNSEKTYAHDQIGSGETTVDLFVAAESANYYFEKKDKQGNYYYEDLSDLFKEKVPGEDVTIEEKMYPYFKTATMVETEDGDVKQFGLPWVAGPMGILYNKTVVEDLLGEDYVMPRTTAELVKMCDDLVEKKTPWVFCSAEDYQSILVDMWWMQYEGLENYQNFWLGQNENGEISSDIFRQQGRLEALKVFESIMQDEYVHDEVNLLDFTMAQSQFILGNGVMQANGDWFENEMRETTSEVKGETVITYLKMPVISSIVDKCEDVKDEATLAAVVDAVDRGETSYEGVCAADFKRIKEARTVVNCIAGHDIYIPSYATAKGVAKDFLKYLVTDKSLNTFIRVTHGASMPYEYDVKTKDPDLYNGLLQIQKDKFDILENATYPLGASYKLEYFGGVSSFSQTKNLSFAFTASYQADRKTAQQIYDAEIAHWTKDGGVHWNLLKQKLGW
ncbi:MAG: hypothetical protein IJ317_05655 [Clostridia bacterium]|nr:hypothetical protein [Clostridia bacterium]